jgi:hypothetical protein
MLKSKSTDVVGFDIQIPSARPEYEYHRQNVDNGCYPTKTRAERSETHEGNLCEFGAVIPV